MSVEDEDAETIIKSAMTRKNLSDPQMALLILIGLLYIGDLETCKKVLNHSHLHPETDVYAAYVYGDK